MFDAWIVQMVARQGKMKNISKENIYNLLKRLFFIVWTGIVLAYFTKEFVIYKLIKFIGSA